MKLQGKRILVVGMARSGIAAALFLRGRGARVVVSEMRAAGEMREEIPRLLDAGVALETGGHRERSFLDAECIVVSPGVPADLPLLLRARAQQIPVWGEIELAARFLRGGVVAITGANGKTTTTSLTGEILIAAGRTVQVGGNIGTPLISLVETSTPETVNVIEVSSFQLETIETFHPQVAAVLNLSPDHLDRHGSMEAYAAAKRRIFLNQTTADRAVLNREDAWCRSFADGLASRVAWFTTGELENAEGACVRRGEIIWRWEGRTLPVMPVAEIPLRGRHNLENVLAAVAIACLVAGDGAATLTAMRAAIGAFKAVEHRLEFVARIRGVDYYNDSKATNVDAALKALEAFDGGVWLILGGKDKGSDYSLLGPRLRERARGVLLIGAATEKIAAQLAPLGVPLTRTGTLDQAVSAAAGLATAGETVLLAPACASFDQFQNYGHRGHVFKELVARLLETPQD